MNNFENDPFQTKQKPMLESFENQSHVIFRNEIEIDLDQEDRSQDYPMENITGFPESKLVAEIETPMNDIGIIHTQLPNLEPVIMLIGSNMPGIRRLLKPGDILDLSDVGEKGKCIVRVDETGHRVFVYAENPDTAYQIFTRELEQLKDAEDYNADDPDY